MQSSQVKMTKTGSRELIVLALLIVATLSFNQFAINTPFVSTTQIDASSITQRFTEPRRRPIDHHAPVGEIRASSSQQLRHRRSPGASSSSSSSSLGPKLVQWSKEALQYYEGSTLVLSCSLSLSQAGEASKFVWFKNGKVLSTTGSSPSMPASHRLSIETLAEYSFLRLADLRPADSGTYTCAASNAHNQEDRTTTQVIVNVKLKWIDGDNQETGSGQNATHAALIKSRAGQSVVFECNAAGGQPRPRVRWFRYLTPGGARGAQSFKLTTGSGASPPAVTPTDETQMRAILNQLSDANFEQLALYHYELAGSRGSLTAPPPAVESQGFDKAANGSGNHHQLGVSRWHIETSSASKSQQEVYSRLVLERLEPAASGYYECEVGATSGPESLLDEPAGTPTLHQLVGGRGGGGDKLRRMFGLLVNDGAMNSNFRSKASLVLLQWMDTQKARVCRFVLSQ